MPAVGAVASRYFYTRSIDRIDYDDDAPTTARKRSPEGRMGVVVSFLALMELIREQLVDLVQNEPFGQIYIKSPEQMN